jgi:hypothetical protein
MFALCVVVYLLTARWYGVVINDSAAAAWPSWSLVHRGTVFLDGLTMAPNPWIQHVDGHVVSNRMPGVALLSAPVQLLLWPLPPLPGSTVTAALAAALGMANLTLLLRRLGGTSRQVVACSATFAFGTAMWPVASAELLTHGPDVLWISSAALAASSGRWFLAGIALAPAVLTRPHLAVVALTLGIWCALARRDWRPALLVGAPATAAVGVLILWNARIYGHASLAGGYPDPVGRALDTSGHPERGSVTLNVLGSLISPMRGVLIYTPVLLVAAAALPTGWRKAPDWAQALLVGGLAYALLQFRLNTFLGGYGYYGNRYLLEALACGAPVAYVGYLALSRDRRWLVAVTRALAALSVSIQAIGATLSFALPIHDTTRDPWRTLLPLDVVEATGTAGVCVAVVALSTAFLWVLRRRSPATLQVQSSAAEEVM